MRTAVRVVPVVLLLALASCQGGRPAGPVAPTQKARISVTEVDQLPPDFKAAAGQSIYVPAYSAILVNDATHPFDLAVTLSVRNTDGDRLIVLTAVRYYDGDGRLVRDFLRRPVRIGPRAAVEYFVPERDRTGGVSASFLVEWMSDQPVTSPVVEAVMVGSAGNQGISFVCPGRVLSGR